MTQQSYSSGYGETIDSMLRERTALKAAAFLLPYLRDGMRLLDVGCGPGTLTSQLAETYDFEQVVGCDLQVTQVVDVHARSSADFAGASTFALPFADSRFDAIFSHAMLYHLHEPVVALREMRRVLREGGVIGIRDSDFGGTLVYPDHDAVREANRLLAAYIRLNGGNPVFGRMQRAALHEAGFVDVRVSASYDVYDTPEKVEQVGHYLRTHLTSETVARALITAGETTQDDLEAMAAGVQAWQRHSEALMMQCRTEAVGFVETKKDAGAS